MLFILNLLHRCFFGINFVALLTYVENIYTKMVIILHFCDLTYLALHQRNNFLIVDYTLFIFELVFLLVSIEVLDAVFYELCLYNGNWCAFFWYLITLTRNEDCSFLSTLPGPLLVKIWHPDTIWIIHNPAVQISLVDLRWREVRQML